MPSLIITRAVELVQEKVIDGIVAVRDESGRDGMRLVFELRKDAISSVILNQLYKYTALQSSFSVNNIALVKGSSPQQKSGRRKRGSLFRRQETGSNCGRQ